MNKLRKLIIMDDDPHYAGMLALKIRMQFPELMVSSYNKADLPGGYDVYVLDNDFFGEKCGAQLAEEVRKIAPRSLVIVLSGTLEFALLKRLVNCHAAGVFDKSKEDDLTQMMGLIDQFLLQSPNQSPVSKSSSFQGTLSGIRGLMKEWNKRLAFEEKRVS
ncbi:MAG: hypothetical protein JJ850_12515 [Kordiimonadaceae bacterium]|nr:hypothetical protein [Kordiimonadaceae bacterium]MBO6570758.1 hypothetical protein [Kordiimonadaceae bacterium]MBO6965439.1 hypothetical protein [Kordiimonadaceae bacterium]